MNQTRAIDQTVAALRLVRDKWGALLAAVEAPPTAADWPPRETTAFLDKLPAAEGPLLVEDREPYALRAHPAPLNLTAHDAVVAVEGMLFDLADTCAAVTQQHTPLDELHRWNYRTQHGHGSRTQGAHWASVYVEGRVLGEQTDGPERLFAPLPGWALHEAHRVARQCADRVLRTLRHDERSASSRYPCPWCASPLTSYSASGDVQRITCSGGPSCSAPVPLDLDGHRVWERSDMGPLLALFAAAMESGESATEQTCVVIGS
ncbi:hypothetical protein [Streptomyces melanogenes]|uniref:hypothetical protein n=1 Tax=Streptomyces melanogenes TaxID=67326 RepID=UPI00167CE912|nr:hypothetical protein [Streptomyces melanogenes]GGP35312.1 hypothetical protein GCM10010278_09670 [Streptomyces melanogenes]